MGKKLSAISFQPSVYRNTEPITLDVTFHILTGSKPRTKFAQMSKLRMSRLLRIGLKVTGVGILSAVGTLFSGPWGPCGPANPTALIFMLAAVLLLPVGALLLVVACAGLLLRKVFAPGASAAPDSTFPA
jgi:hypothetical protein